MLSKKCWILAFEAGSSPEKKLGHAFALFYVSPTFGPGPSSPSLGSFHL